MIVYPLSATEEKLVSWGRRALLLFAGFGFVLLAALSATS